jgi:hypothetical protein
VDLVPRRHQQIYRLTSAARQHSLQNGVRPSRGYVSLASPSGGMAIKRRTFIAALGGALTWPVVARAQQVAVPIVGLIPCSRG